MRRRRKSGRLQGREAGRTVARSKSSQRRRPLCPRRWSRRREERDCREQGTGQGGAPLAGELDARAGKGVQRESERGSEGEEDIRGLVPACKSASLYSPSQGNGEEERKARARRRRRKSCLMFSRTRATRDKKIERESLSPAFCSGIDYRRRRTGE